MDAPAAIAMLAGVAHDDERAGGGPIAALDGTADLLRRIEAIRSYAAVSPSGMRDLRTSIDVARRMLADVERQARGGRDGSPRLTPGPTPSPAPRAHPARPTADAILAHLRSLGWSVVERVTVDVWTELTARRPGEMDRVGTAAGDDEGAYDRAAVRLDVACGLDVEDG